MKATTKFYLLFALWLVIVTTGITLSEVINRPYPISFDRQIESAKADTLKWNQFLKCSADQGDLGCDSCFYAIYGYHTDASFYSNY